MHFSFTFITSLLFAVTYTLAIPIHRNALAARSESSLFSSSDLALEKRELAFELDERDLPYQLDERDLFERSDVQHSAPTPAAHQEPVALYIRSMSAGTADAHLEKRKNIFKKIGHFFKKVGKGIKKAATSAFKVVKGVAGMAMQAVMKRGLEPYTIAADR